MKMKSAPSKQTELPTSDAVVFHEHSVLQSQTEGRAMLEAHIKTSAQAYAKPSKLPDGAVDWNKGLRTLGDKPEPDFKTFRPKAIVNEAPKTTVEPPAPYLDKGVFPTAGLALSGGGIRSAAFCTGAVQALAFGKTYDVFDYLSTVSGGGYLGALLTLNKKAGAEFILLDPGGDKKDTPAVQHLRDKVNYLRFGDPVQMLRNAAIYLRGLIANFFILAMVLFFLAAITVASNSTYASLSKSDFFGFPLPEYWGQLGVFAISLGIIVALFLFNICWANVLGWRRGSHSGIWSGILWFAAFIPVLLAIVLFLELQPLLIKKMIGEPTMVSTVGSCASGTLHAQCTSPEGTLSPKGVNCPTSRLVYSCAKEAAIAAGPSTDGALQNLISFGKAMLAPILALATLLSSSLGEFFRQGSAKNTWTNFVIRNTSKILVYLAAAAFLLLLWIAYLYLVYWGIQLPADPFLVDRKIPVAVEWSAAKFMQWTETSGSYALFYFCVAVVLLLLVFKLKPNANSLHGLYRDRLGEAFCFKMEGNETKPAATTKLSELATVRPIQLLNAAINLQRSPVVKRSGRKADFFIFSPLWTGSEATGYAPTEGFEKLDGGGDLDIATAVAVSGAAVSSNMGSQSMRPLSLLLGALNVRLGFWSPNPQLLRSGSKLRPSLWYFLAETMGWMEENSNTVYLTDGGHLENLGIYELLRRRCRLIVAIDAEADPEMSFRSFVMLQRYARIDLGARINLNWSEIASTTRSAMADLKFTSSGPHCAIGTIEYDGGGHGVLVYVKLSVTGDENDYIRDYNMRNNAFPHESTGDQFFTEEQFEAYRALGFHAVNGMLSGKQKVQSLAGKLEHLDDAKATGEGVKLAAELLGVKTKVYKQAKPEPNIHLVRMVR